MEEQLISFETAKLAKEKGFFIKGSMYGLDGKPVSDAIKFLNEETFSRCSQSLLQKWLREEHKIYMNITPMTMVGYVVYYKGEVANSSMVWDESIKVKGNTYEDALENVLQEALKLI